MEKAKIQRAKDGKLKPGSKLNPNGRPKGASNRTTKEMRQIIKEYISNELENVDSLLEKLSPKERLDILTKLLPFVLPKQQEIVDAIEKEIIISFKD